jgi:succinoglycan biosynthesis protein ExoA
MSAHPPLPPLGPAPTVSVIVPARAAEETLSDTVTAALQPEVSEVVIAVADGPTRAVATELAAQDPERVRVVPNPTGRTPDALNRAIEAAVGQVIVRVDAHSLLPAGYVARAVDVLRHTGAGNVGGRQVPVAGQGFARAVAAAMVHPAGAGGALHRNGRSSGPADTVYLGVFRREALEAVGGFDARFTRNQDAELNLRLRRAGYEVWFDPDLAVEYKPRESARGLARQYFDYGRWRRLTAQVHPGSLAARQLAPPALVACLAATATLSIVRRDARPVASATVGYSAALLASAVTARPGWRAVPSTAGALGIMHLSWGVGFLLGPPRSGLEAPHGDA